MNSTSLPIEHLETDLYGYVPSKSVAIIMLVLFGLSSLVHIGQSLYHRAWYLIPTAVLCGVLEVLGWSGRLWSHMSPTLIPPFQIQITATILGPTPLLAAVFVIFGEIIRKLGTSYSRLSTRLYTIIFCTCDVVSLLIQGTGGGIAASADDTGGDPQVGADIMLAGVVFQLIVIVLFAICAVEYLVRYRKDRPVSARLAKTEQRTPRGVLTNKIRIMLGALSLTITVLFIRAVYRTIELADGWDGRIIRTEVYFNVLDGAMIVIAMYLINIFHPSVLLKEPAIPAQFSPAEPKEPRSHGSTITSNSLA